MIGDLCKLVTNVFTMKRWGSNPTIEEVVEADNLGYSLHVAFLLAKLEQKNGKDINTLDLIERALLKELPKCILADISVETKKLIREIAPDEWEKTYESAIDDIINLTPESLKEDFRNKMLTAKDDTIEGQILSAADLYAASWECEINSRVYPEYYNDIKENIIKAMDEINLPSLLRIRTEGNLRKYLLKIRALIYSIRWNARKRNIETTVAGHSFYVTFLAYFLGRWEKYKFGNELDLNRVLSQALFHDIPESLTGDIISPTKRRVKGFEEVIDSVEEQMVTEKLLPLLPEEIRDELRTYMLKPFDGGLEGKIVKSADLLACLIETIMEQQTGNTQEFFKEAHDSTKEMIKQLNVKSTDYFLEWSLGDISPDERNQ